MTSTPIFLAGRSEVHRLVHARGIGDVYRGRLAGGDPLAVKIFAPRWTRDPSAVEHCVEIASLALEHRCLARIRDAGRLACGRLYVATDWIAGEPLEDALPPDARLEPAHVAALVSDIADALDALHERAIVHRTINAAKIVVAADRLVLTGYAAGPLLMAPEGRDAKRYTPVHASSPTSIELMAPETGQSSALDRSIDVYALAALAFRMLTGRFPFPARSTIARALIDRQAAPAPMLCEVAHETFPKALEAAIARGLARDPSERHPSAGELASELRVAAGVADGEALGDVHRGAIAALRGHAATVDERVAHDRAAALAQRESTPTLAPSDERAESRSTGQSGTMGVRALAAFAITLAAITLSALAIAASLGQ